MPNIITYENGKRVARPMTTEEVAALDALQPTIEDARAAMECTRLQGLLVLGETEVERLHDFINSLPNSWAMRQIVEHSEVWRRNSQDMKMIGHALGYTPEQMDALFIEAQDLRDA